MYDIIGKCEASKVGEIKWVWQNIVLDDQVHFHEKVDFLNYAAVFWRLASSLEKDHVNS